MWEDIGGLIVFLKVTSPPIPKSISIYERPVLISRQVRSIGKIVNSEKGST